MMLLDETSEVQFKPWKNILKQVEMKNKASRLRSHKFIRKHFGG